MYINVFKNILFDMLIFSEYFIIMSIHMIPICSQNNYFYECKIVYKNVLTVSRQPSVKKKCKDP